jgi:hypothetical protein
MHQDNVAVVTARVKLHSLQVSYIVFKRPKTVGSEII